MYNQVQNVCAIWWEKILETIYSSFFVLIKCIFLKPYLSCVYCCNLMCLCHLYLLYLMCICCILCVFVYLMCICCTFMCICCIYVYLLYSYVYLLYYVCIDILTLNAGLLARSQYPEGPATGHLETGFS